jgi:glycosyltransferase involved in cell wall biosynthesis
MLSAKQASKFDIIHNHRMSFLPYAELIATPVLTTLHGGGLSEAEKIRNKFLKKVYYVAISKYSAKIAKKNNFNIIDTIYNGINLKNFSFNPRPKKYLSWLGRLDPEKGAHIAIKVAKKSNQNLKLAGIINDEKRKKYWKKEILEFERQAKERAKLLEKLKKEKNLKNR